MKAKRLLSLLLPIAVLLSGCQQVLATNHTLTNPIMISHDVESYHQTLILKTETETKKEIGISETEELYSIAEATLYPMNSLAYGSRIIKNKNRTPAILNMYSSKDGAFIQKNNGEWISSATLDPVFTSIEIYPYETFIELSEIFTEKGTWIETGDEFIIDYSGVDAEINERISTLLEQFPVTNTYYDVSISINRNDNRLVSFSYRTEVEHGQQKVTQEINSVFSNYNLLTEQNASENLQSFIESHLINVP